MAHNMEIYDRVNHEDSTNNAKRIKYTKSTEFKNSSIYIKDSLKKNLLQDHY